LRSGKEVSETDLYIKKIECSDTAITKSFSTGRMRLKMNETRFYFDFGILYLFKFYVHDITVFDYSLVRSSCITHDKIVTKMTRRRSITEIRASSNPFMVTSNHAAYALDMGELKRKISKKNQIDAEARKAGMGTDFSKESREKKHDLSFIYRRESDKVGAGIESSDSSLAKVMSVKESLSDAAKRKRTAVFANYVEGEIAVPCDHNKTPEQIKAILQEYNHVPKMEHPLYITTSNQIGLKRPSLATYTAEKHPRSQKFSSSFNRKMFGDQGLNTSMTRSKFHESLDPQML